MKPSELTFRNPLTEECVAACLRELLAGWPAEATLRVLDVGCGNGEVLARLREMRLRTKADDCVVLGVDSDGDALARAALRHAAVKRAYPGGATEKARWVNSTWEDAPGTEGPWEAAICMGSRHAFGTGVDARETMLGALCERLVPRGRLLLADGYWRQAPAEDYLAASKLTAAELVPLDAWHALFATRGLRVRHECLTTPDEFEAFERVFWAQGGEHWDTWSQAFLRWGKQTMGFAAWVLEREEVTRGSESDSD